MGMRLKKKLAYILSLVMMVTMIGTNASIVKADQTACEISVSATISGTAGNYGLVVKQRYNGEYKDEINVPFGSSAVNNSRHYDVENEATALKFTLTTAGHTVNSVTIAGHELNADEITALTSDTGYVLNISGSIPSSVAATVNITGGAGGEGGGAGGEGGGAGGAGGEGGHNNPPPLPTFVNPETITANITEGSGILEQFGKEYEKEDHSRVTYNSYVMIDGYVGNGSEVKVEQASTHTVELLVEFGEAVSKVEINGDEYTPEDMGEGKIKVADVPDAATYSIKVVKGVSDDVTIVWATNEAVAEKLFQDAGACVKNGKVEVVKIVRGGETVYEEGEQWDPMFGSIGDDSSMVSLKRGDDVVVKLIPNYGYQLKTLTINDQDLTPESEVSTFAINNIQGNMHFSSIFVKADDKITVSGNTVSGASIANGENAASTGNLSLTVADNKNYSKDVTSVVAGQSEKVASLDLTLDNVVSKANGSYWTNNITEFSKDITVGVTLKSSDLVEGETYTVVRDHNGTLKEIEATYDETTKKLSFKTNQFSTYTIVKKAAVKTKVQYDEVSADDLTSEMKAAGITTVEKVVEELTKKVKEKVADVSASNSIVYEAELKISLDGGNTWVAATKDNFPAEGLTITIPYPEGVDPAKFDFIVAHMFGQTMTVNGVEYKAGEVELPTVTKTSEGIKVTVKSLSPIMVTWKEAETPQTGDTTNTNGYFAMIIAAICAMSAAFVMKKRKDIF